MPRLILSCISAMMCLIFGRSLIKTMIFSRRSAQNRFWYFSCTANLLLWLDLKGFCKIMIFSIWKKFHNGNRGMHIFGIWLKPESIQCYDFPIFLSTSTDCNSSQRWSWVMFKHTGTMCSSRYVDSQPLNCSITNLGAPNRARKLTEFWQNHRSGACTTLEMVLSPQWSYRFEQGDI